ncbi:MAG: hypothetical protein JWM46_532 [Candidatus Kaiserbacteria bacterium]|nr:hypothetical protein [Candidatus Kaiserbacteria bacterium]
MTYIDLTLSFTDDMPVDPGDPKSELKQIADIASAGYVDHLLHTAMHVGTHIDAPLHMLDGGKRITDFVADKFFGRGVLIDVRGAASIGADALANGALQKGDIVLFLTGFSEKFRTPDYYDKHPEITPEAAEVLVAAGVSIVGMDMPSPDRPPFHTHRILLGKDILIIENLTNLEELIGKEFDVIALPAKLEAEAAPVRVVAKIR